MIESKSIDSHVIHIIYSHVILCQFASDFMIVSSVFRGFYRVGKLVYQADKIVSSDWLISSWIINEFEKHVVYNCLIKYRMFTYIASSFKIHISHCQFSMVICLMAGSSLMTPVHVDQFLSYGSCLRSDFSHLSHR